MLPGKNESMGRLASAGSTVKWKKITGSRFENIAANFLIKDATYDHNIFKKQSKCLLPLMVDE